VTNNNLDLLRQVVEKAHGGRGLYKHSVKIHAMPPRPGMWDGIIHVFSLSENPAANLAYAWEVPVQGSASSRYFAVLHQGRVRSPADALVAVLAAMRSEQEVPQEPRPLQPALAYA
jgi:hypothetical protein